MARPGTNLWKFTNVAMADTPPPQADSVYGFAATKDNEDSPLPAMARLYTSKRVPRVICSGAGPYKASADNPVSYPGFGLTMLQLGDLGVPREAITGLTMPAFWHAAVEAREFILHERERESETLFIVAFAPQLPRCFANAVSQAIRNKYRVKIYAIRGELWTGFWAEQALHSQGAIKAPRIDLTDGEYTRLWGQVGKADVDLVRHKKLVEYLYWREGMSQSFPRP